MSTENSYDLGSLVTLGGLFYSDADETQLADPSTVTLSIRDPAGVITTPTPERVSLGTWTYAWQPTLPGMHEARWVATGDVVAANQEPVFIKVGLDTGLDLCTLADVRQALDLEDTTDRDALIQVCITAASRALARRYGRQLAVLGVQTFLFEGRGRLIDLSRCDLQNTDDLVITLDPGGDDELVLDPATDFKLRPARSDSGTYYRVLLGRSVSLPSVREFGFFDVQIVASWGFPAIDEDVRRATVITASAWIDRAVAGYEMPDVGAVGMNYVPARASTWAIPAAAHSLVQSLERVVVA